MQIIRRYATHHEEERHRLLKEIAKLHDELKQRAQPFVDRLIEIDAITPVSMIVPDDGRAPLVPVTPPSSEPSYSKVPLRTCENCGYKARILYGSQWKCACGCVNPVQ